jgi:hypothetical protein
MNIAYHQENDMRLRLLHSIGIKDKIPCLGLKQDWTMKMSSQRRALKYFNFENYCNKLRMVPS